MRPALIVEMTLPETARLDRSTKVAQYNRARVPLYVIVDTVMRRGQPRPRLLGYERVAGAYERLAPNERGWLWLEPVRVWLGIQDHEIACYDEAGRLLGDYVALVATIAELEAARAEAERQARLEAEARLRAMVAELARLRGH